MNKKVLIYGSKEFGLTIKALAEDCNMEFAGFIDDFNKGKNIIGNYKSVKYNFSTKEYKIALAIGYNDIEARCKIYKNIIKDGYELATLIHSKAYVSENSVIGKGVLIMAGAVIDSFVKIEEAVVVWPGVVVNHNCNIGANTFLSPNSTICGKVTIGKNCFVGAGATIVDHLKIPEKSFIKAGSLYKK